MTSAQASGDTPGLTIEAVPTEDGTLTLRCSGELDYSTARLLRDHGHDAVRTDAATVVVDLREVDFVDSAGLGTLVEIHRRLREDGHAMVLRTTQSSTLAVLRTSGMDGYFTVRTD